MLLIYKAPDGRTYQYEEGEQPEGYVEVKAIKAPANKGRSTRNKSRKTQGKEA